MELEQLRQLDGHTFLVYGQVGYWRQVHERMLPCARTVFDLVEGSL